MDSPGTPNGPAGGGRAQPAHAGAADRPYVLMAGVDEAVLLKAGFDSEPEARAAFRVARLQREPAFSWAQLVARSEADGGRRVCWFGPQASAIPPPPTAGPERGWPAASPVNGRSPKTVRWMQALVLRTTARRRPPGRSLDPTQPTKGEVIQ